MNNIDTLDHEVEGENVCVCRFELQFHRTPGLHEALFWFQRRFAEQDDKAINVSGFNPWPDRWLSMAWDRSRQAPLSFDFLAIAPRRIICVGETELVNLRLALQPLVPWLKDANGVFRDVHQADVAMDNGALVMGAWVMTPTSLELMAASLRHVSTP